VPRLTRHIRAAFNNPSVFIDHREHRGLSFGGGNRQALPPDSADDGVDQRAGRRIVHIRCSGIGCNLVLPFVHR
jgi:hypothetical protein